MSVVEQARGDIIHSLGMRFEACWSPIRDPKSRGGTAATEATISSRYVLVVDDDDDIRDAIVVLLDLQGWVALGACDGLDALQQIRLNGPPDVVLLDLWMPG